jgi:hypothetical protein
VAVGQHGADEAGAPVAVFLLEPGGGVEDDLVGGARLQPGVVGRRGRLAAVGPGQQEQVTDGAVGQPEAVGQLSGAEAPLGGLPQGTADREGNSTRHGPTPDKVADDLPSR